MRGYLSFLTLRFRVVTSTTGLLASVLLGAGCSSKPEQGETPDPEDASPVAQAVDAGRASDGGQRDARAGGGDASLGIGNISVGADSLACSANLAFHPKGCLCNAGSTASCWTGLADRRNVGGCHDGVQECQNQGEFAVWGACEGEVRDCPAPVEDAGVPGDCGCKPGAKILCSEDCAQLIICSLTGTKTCGPDGKWGSCREEFLEGLENVSLCKNLYYSCIPGQEDGLFVGDCDDSFTCGHVPGNPPTTPPVQTPPVDGGTSTPSVQ
jgi:hypothetical protein